MVPSTIEHWARTGAPGTRRYRVFSATGRTVLYSTTFDGLGQQYAVFPDATAACLAIDAGAVSWRLDLSRARADKVPA